MAEDNPDGLEQKVNDKESKGFMRKAVDLGFNTAFAAGATLLGLSTAGIAAPMIGAGFGGGLFLGGLFNKKKSFYESLNEGIVTYSGVNTVLYPMIWLGDMTYPLFSSDLGGQMAKGAYALTGYLATFMGLFRGAAHLSENKLNPKGIGESITKDFWPEYKRLAWTFGPGLLLTANGVNWLNIGGYNVHTFAANALPTGIYNAYNPPVSPTENSTQVNEKQREQASLEPQPAPG